MCEDTILNRPTRNTALNPKEEIVFKHAVNAATKLRDNFEILGVEKIIFNEKLINLSIYFQEIN
jgi:DNA primase